MKLFKRLFSYLVALTMVLSLATFAGVNVHAAGDGQRLEITINNAPSGRKYTAYQIFTGKYYKGTLSDIKWGQNVDSGNLLTKLSKDTDNFSGITTSSKAADVAEKLSGIENDSAKAQAFAKYVAASTTGAGTASVENNGATTITVTNSGYYLVEDTTDNADQSSKNEYYTRYIVKVVGEDTNIDLKGNVPTVVKKVQDKNDSTGTTSDWQDSADYDIGDEIPYKLTGTLPTDYDKYDTYYYKFTDTMTNLTYKDQSLVVTANGSNVDSKYYTAKFDSTTKVLTVEFTDLKKVIAKYSEGAKVVVTYTATLDKEANIGSKGNPNTVYLTYSNNPNNTGNGETGKTPDDKNIVFTYKTVVNKVDQDKKSLAGAAFKLEKKKSDGTYTLVKEFTAGTETTFEFTGLDDGVYKLTETTTPAGYNTIAPIEFTISAEHDADSLDPKLTSLNGIETTGEITLSGNQKANVDKTAGSITTTVENQKGSTLPSTGGMGTTLLYAAGGILVACAVAYVMFNKKHAK